MKKDNWFISFVKWIGSFIEPFRSTIRIQMFITMFFMFEVIRTMAVAGDYDYMVIVLLIVASFVPKLLEKFAPAWLNKLKSNIANNTIENEKK